MFKDANVTLIVSDMDRAIKFYTETLGLRLLANYGGHFAEVQAPGVKIGLHPGKPAKEASRGMSLGFRVDDYEATAKELEARGVKIEKTPQDKGSRTGYFSDPDGYPLYVIEIKFG